MTLVNEITAYLTALLNNRLVLAIVVGLVFALALTQWFKFVLLRTTWLPDPQKWIVRAIALPLGALACFLTLPEDMPLKVRVIVALAIGAAAPYVYQLATAVLYRGRPQLEARMSADPYRESECRPGGGL
jgi:hypothetical protein